MAEITWSLLGQKYTYDITSWEIIPRLLECVRHMEKQKKAYQQQRIGSRTLANANKIFDTVLEGTRKPDYRHNAWYTSTKENQLKIMQQAICVKYTNHNKVASWNVETENDVDQIKEFIMRETTFLLVKRKRERLKQSCAPSVGRAPRPTLTHPAS